VAKNVAIDMTTYATRIDGSSQVNQRRIYLKSKQHSIGSSAFSAFSAEGLSQGCIRMLQY
jgi:hypothetical protein